uniref:Secreted protein n=1 Tax=Candidatus Kentrum sp. LPFa TaxID=2126335 RepID=A0A450WE89_9GAMM|nr:MAG: hypothetical protein BECKLPF1236A_GA0070988_1012412 [Candidatus Kentron sp. LPFa]
MKKLLKGSLVAAFLALGMWAAQASGGCNCNGFHPPIESELCDEAIVCAGSDCGQQCVSHTRVLRLVIASHAILSPQERFPASRRQSQTP